MWNAALVVFMHHLIVHVGPMAVVASVTHSGTVSVILERETRSADLEHDHRDGRGRGPYMYSSIVHRPRPDIHARTAVIAEL